MPDVMSDSSRMYAEESHQCLAVGLGTVPSATLARAVRVVLAPCPPRTRRSHAAGPHSGRGILGLLYPILDRPSTCCERLANSAAEEVLKLARPAQSGRQTAHQFTLDVLRTAILDGSLPAGTPLVQTDIAQQLDVSTTPVREALRELSAEGLVRVDAHRGAVVQGLSIADIREIFEVRLLLEPEVFRRATHNLSDDEIVASSSEATIP